MAKKTPFSKLKGKLSHEKGVYDPSGLAATIGRKSMGTSKFNKMAAKGRSHGRGR